MHARPLLVLLVACRRRAATKRLDEQVARATEVYTLRYAGTPAGWTAILRARLPLGFVLGFALVAAAATAATAPPPSSPTPPASSTTASTTGPSLPK